MTTYPLATLACTIDAAGISAPSYADILASLQASYRSIYGSDVVLTADSQDGQWLAIQASAINDANAQTIACFNAFSPSTAQGAGLSSVVKINGLARLVATNSTADVTITGDVGTVITNGQVQDTLGQVWNLPSTVTIESDGDVIATAVAADLGDINAAVGTINRILTPTRGWQTVTNVAAATAGAPVETDAQLRQRQAVSTSLPALTPLEAIVAAVANLTGVQRYKPYENDTASTDGNGIPSHSISLVVEGGDAFEIATAIASKKAPGTGTYGTTSEVITDSMGIPNTIRFYRPTDVPIEIEIVGDALAGYVSTTGDVIKAALLAYVNGLDIGGDVYLSKITAAANIPSSPLSATFNITSVEMSRDGNPVAPADIAIAFNEAASLILADISLSVT